MFHTRHRRVFQAYTVQTVALQGFLSLAETLDGNDIVEPGDPNQCDRSHKIHGFNGADPLRLVSGLPSLGGSGG